MNLPRPEDFVDVHVAPGRAIYRKNCLLDARIFTTALGDCAGVVATMSNRERLPTRYGCMGTTDLLFPGEATADAVTELCTAARQAEVDFIVGQGGGKTIDTAKRVAWELRLPCVAVPTSSATCAAFTALAVEYGPSGDFRTYHYLSKPPDLMLMDPEVVTAAPRRLLAAGVADTVAKWVETVSSAGRIPATWLGRHSLLIASDALEMLLQTVPENFADNRQMDEQLNYANVILSGLSSGIGGMTAHATIAHALCNGFTRLKGVKHPLHGETIAFTLALQLKLERFEPQEKSQILSLFNRCGLPVCGRQYSSMLGVDLSRERLAEVYQYAISEDETALLSSHHFSLEELLQAVEETDRETLA